jgi:uncharacterized membrane protein YphA (DoxX/SURF4 family)
MLASIFVAGGYHAFANPAKRAKAAEHLLTPLGARLRSAGLPDDPETLVKANGLAQMVAGALLATNILARPAALALTATLVPASVGAHAFWQKQGEERTAQRTLFLKNVAIAGGLVTAALDTGGRPSVFWTTKRAARRAAGAVADRAGDLSEALPSRS